ncbi:MAG: phytoene desaturase family protein [Fibrobacterota bacterium]
MKTVIIGTGLSGLTTGAFLAQKGHEVTLIDQHYQIGGCAHNFSRKHYTFEAAIHTAPLSEDGVIFSLLQQLGLDGEIVPVEQDEMFRVTTSHASYCIPQKKEDIQNYFYTVFPHESSGLNRFFTDLEEMRDKMFTLFTPDKKGYLDKDPEFSRKFQGRSYSSYLESLFTDPELIAVLGGQWPYVGISPEYGSRLFLTMLFATHYFNGSHSVKGGFARLAECLAQYIQKRGGHIVLRKEVRGFSGENKRITTVHTETASYEGDCIVSDINPYLLHTKLLPENMRSRRILRRLNMLSPSLSSVAVYLGMKEGYETLISGNVIAWYRDIHAYSDIYTAARRGLPYDEDHLVALKPKEYLGKKPTLTLLSFAHQNASDNWKEDKKETARRMIERLKKIYPGIEGYINHVEIGSPDTFYRYTRSQNGAIYGFENSCDPFRETKMGYTTHIKNLYQCGHWTIPGCGVYNVMTNGFTVAQKINSDIDNEKI